MISVIVPVYNAALYLKNLVDCFSKQTYKDFELIMVDDGSKDESWLILKELAEKNTFIYPIHQNNGGVSNARNVGIKYANGEWICFCDADDAVAPNWLQNFVNSIDDEIDVVFQGAEIRRPNGEFEYTNFPQIILNGIDDFYDIWESNHHMGTAWSKLIRKCIVVPFREDLSYYEDQIFCFEVVLKARRMYSITQCGYIYHHENSVLSTKQRTAFDGYKLIQNRIEIAQDIRCKSVSVYDKYIGEMTILFIAVLLGNAKDHTLSIQQKETVIDIVKENYDLLVPTNRREGIICWMIKYGFYSLIILLVKIKFCIDSMRDDR